MFVRTIGSIFVAYLSLGILTSREVDPADARALSEAAQMANTHATAAALPPITHSFSPPAKFRKQHGGFSICPIHRCRLEGR